MNNIKATKHRKFWINKVEYWGVFEASNEFNIQVINFKFSSTSEHMTIFLVMC